MRNVIFVLFSCFFFFLIIWLSNILTISDTSAGEQLVFNDIIRIVATASTLTWFTRYIYA
jgi:hypothetical protein